MLPNDVSSRSDSRLHLTSLVVSRWALAIGIGALVVGASSPVTAQTPSPVTPSPASPSIQQTQPAPAAQQTQPVPAAGGDYRIGPGDVITVSVLQAPEINGALRVSEQGAISMPMVGSVSVQGLTPRQVEDTIEARLKEKYIREPDVTVQVTEMQSHAVSVLGAVHKPGVYQVRATTSLLELLSLAEGVAENAGDTVVVIRASGSPEAASEPGKEIPLKTLLSSSDPTLNVPIHAGDVVKVLEAAMVYVVGAVTKAGAFPMPSNEPLTVLRALALGGGTVPTAATGDAVILRATGQGPRQQVPVPLDRILKSKSPDVALQPQDVLFVPTSGGKVAARVALDALTRIVTLRPVIP